MGAGIAEFNRAVAMGSYNFAVVIVNQDSANRHFIAGGGFIWRHGDRTAMHMRAFSDDFLERYLAEAGENVCRSVGAYQLEGMGAQLFDEIEGDYFSILGLPLLPMMRFLREKGIIAT